MKLFYSPTSPYARKCRIVLKLSQLNEHAELALINPLDDESFRQINPLSKIPALTHHDLVLFDSPLICEYIDNIAVSEGKPSLFKKTSNTYFSIQKIHAQADGILDAALATVMELRRDTEQSNYWIQRWQKAIMHAIKTLDLTEIGHTDDVHIGTIATASALAYIDFRLKIYNWREQNNQLAHWFEEIEHTDWMKMTRPE